MEAIPNKVRVEANDFFHDWIKLFAKMVIMVKGAEWGEVIFRKVLSGIV
jgi:hypothetical protein